MSDTFCGKSCEQCTNMINKSCTGCKAGTEAGENGKCKIANCCKKNQHESCESCEFMTFCTDFCERNHMAVVKFAGTNTVKQNDTTQNRTLDLNRVSEENPYAKEEDQFTEMDPKTRRIIEKNNALLGKMDFCYVYSVFSGDSRRPHVKRKLCDPKPRYCDGGGDYR